MYLSKRIQCISKINRRVYNCRPAQSILDKTIQYAYNGIGNIESVTKNGVTTTFGYDDAHPDRLISYNGKTIGYDTMGRVSSYDGYSYSWANGKLSRRFKGNIRTGSTNYSYSYNANGQRIGAGYSRTLGMGDLNSVQTGEVMRYNKVFHYDHMGRLVAESNTKELHMSENVSESIVYLYDENTVIGMVHTEYGETNTYYFLRNLLGDVVGIYDTNGNKVVGYSYDAWGNCTIDSTTTNYPLAHTNPIRYRGYYYDEDANLYCLGARYYSPEWRRFISPDDTAYLDPETPNGLNLYCYCGNDPVNFVDPSGHLAFSAFLIGCAIVGLSAVAGAASGAIISGAAYLISTTNYNSRDFLATVAGGAVSGGMMGGLAGIFLITGGSAAAVMGWSTAIGIIGNGVGTLVEGSINGNWQADPSGYFLNEILPDMIWGGIFGALGGAMIGAQMSASATAKKLGRTLTKQMTKILRYKVVRTAIPNLFENLLMDFTGWYTSLVVDGTVDRVFE